MTDENVSKGSLFFQLKPDAVLAGVPLPPRAKDDDDARGKADLLAILRRGAAAEAAEREKKPLDDHGKDGRNTNPKRAAVEAMDVGEKAKENLDQNEVQAKRPKFNFGVFKPKQPERKIEPEPPKQPQTTKFGIHEPEKYEHAMEQHEPMEQHQINLESASQAPEPPKYFGIFQPKKHVGTDAPVAPQRNVPEPQVPKPAGKFGIFQPKPPSTAQNNPYQEQAPPQYQASPERQMEPRWPSAFAPKLGGGFSGLADHRAKKDKSKFNAGPLKPQWGKIAGMEDQG